MNTSDGDVKISITADDSGLKATLQQTIASLDSLKASVAGVNATMTQNTTALNAAAATFASSARGAKGLSDALNDSHINAALLTRELLVMGREISQGRLNRLAGSATILARSFGVGSAAILGTAAAAAAVIIPLAAVGYEFAEAAKESENLKNALAATGNAAGLTEGQLYEMSNRLAAETHKSASSMRDLELQAARSGKVGSAALEAIAFDATKMAEALGEKPAAAMKTLIDLTGDVAKKSAELNEQLHFLTEGQWLEIKAMEESGNKAGAAATALDLLRTHLQSVGSDAKGLTWVLQGLSGAIDGVIEKLRQQGREILGQATLKDQIASIQAKRDQYAFDMGNNAPGLKQYDDQIAALQRKENAQEAADAAQAKSNAYQQQGIDLDLREGKQKSELQQAQDDLSVSTQRLAIARRVAAGEASTMLSKEQALQELASGNDQANIAAEQRRIAELQKRMAGPKGPQVNQVELWKAQLDQIVRLDADSKDRQLADEVKFWADKLASIQGGGVKAVNLRNQISALEFQAEQRLTATQDEAAKRAAKMAEDIARARADGQARVASIGADAERKTGEDVVDANIAALRRRMDAESSFRRTDIIQMKSYLAQKQALELAAAGADYTANTHKDAEDSQSAIGDPVAQAKADEAYKVHYAQYVAQLLDIKSRYAALGVEVDANAAQKSLEAFKKTATGIADTMRTTMEGLIERTTTWQKVWLDVQRKMLDGFLRMGEQMIVSNLTKNSAIVAQDRSAAALKGQLDLAQSLAQIRNDAAKAAAGAFQAMMQLGPIGVVLAPAAAATAFGAVAAYEGGLAAFSAAGGMDIPRGVNPVVQTHAEEMILPARIANPMREMLTSFNRPGSSNNSRAYTHNGDNHFHQAPGQSSRDFARDVQAALFEGKRRSMYDPRKLGVA